MKNKWVENLWLWMAVKTKRRPIRASLIIRGWLVIRLGDRAFRDVQVSCYDPFNYSSLNKVND